MSTSLSTLHGDGPCADCGNPENIVWFTDDALWNQAVRSDLARWDDREPILCHRCFIEAVERAGIYPVSWRLIPQYPQRRVDPTP